MRKILIIVGAFLFTAVVITFSLVHWNNKIEMTQEKAKEKIEVVKKIDSHLTGHTSANPVKSMDSSKNADLSGNQSKADLSGNQSNDDSNVATSTASDNSTVTTASANDGDIIVEPQGGTAEASGISLEEIKAAYKEVFTELEVQEGSKIDQVVVQAKADFVSKKYSKEELIAKYQELAELLETNADKTFNAYYKQLQLNLEKYGHDANEAIVFKNEYNAKKQERMTHVISELSQF